MTHTFIHRNGTTAEWSASTRVLRKGEPGFDTELNIQKYGDGEHVWADLPSLVPPAAAAVTVPDEASAVAAQQFLRKLDANANATWLNFGDSLSDATTDWPYLTALHLGGLYRTHTVSWQTANSAGWVGSPSSLRVGTGGSTLSVRNAAVGGYDSPTWTTAINANLLSGVTPDLITVFLSHNDSNVEATFKANFLALLLAIKAQWAGVPIVVGVQNQSTTQPTNTINHRLWILEVARATAGVWVHENVWKAFGETTPVAAYYIDNVHPTTAGVLALKNAWLTALGIPEDSAVALASQAVAPLSAQLASVIGALATQFDPRSLLNWNAAYWAADPDWTKPADGGKVTSWRDAKGGGKDVSQAVTAEQPTYRASTAMFNGKPTIEFLSANSQSLLSGAFTSIPQPFTLVVVGETDVLLSGTFADLASSTSNNSYYNGLNSSAGVFWQMNQGSTLRGGSPAINTPVMWVGRFNGASSFLDINNGNVAAGNAGASSAAEIRLGRSSTGTAHTAALDGHLAFVGIIAGDAPALASWPLFAAWVAAHYGITMVA